MKNFCAVFLFIALFIGCDKEEQGQASQDWTQVSIPFNDTNLVFSGISGSSLLDGTQEIQFSHLNVRNIPRWSFIGINIPQAIGKYNLLKQDPNARETTMNMVALSQYIDDGDVIGEFYEMIDSDSFADYIEIQSITSTRVQGRMQCSFVKTSNFGLTPNNPPPELIEIGPFDFDLAIVE